MLRFMDHSGSPVPKEGPSLVRPCSIPVAFQQRSDVAFLGRALTGTFHTA